MWWKKKYTSILFVQGVPWKQLFLKDGGGGGRGGDIQCEVIKHSFAENGQSTEGKTTQS